MVYVYQQSAIFYLGYSGAKKQTLLTDLLEKNNILRYNINKFSSLTCLDKKIMSNSDLEIPAVKQLVKINLAEDFTITNKELKRRPNLIFSFFGRTRDAQAETINR